MVSREYAELRLGVPARVGRAQAVLRADVNVGNPVTPRREALPNIGWLWLMGECARQRSR
jgi:hypothetical protein